MKTLLIIMLCIWFLVKLLHVWPDHLIDADRSVQPSEVKRLPPQVRINHVFSTRHSENKFLSCITLRKSAAKLFAGDTNYFRETSTTFLLKFVQG